MEKNIQVSDEKRKIALPPQLPPNVADYKIEVSDEDLEFFNENRDYAGLLCRLDTQSITKHVTHGECEGRGGKALYEKRNKKRLLKKEEGGNGNGKEDVEVDPVDALHVKTLDGKLYFRTDFLLLCVLAKCYKSGLGILEEDIFEVDQPKDFFLYCYYGKVVGLN